MKNKNILKTTILAAVGVALSATSAQAAPLTYNLGDLLLGFRQGSAGATTDYVINIGQYSSYIGAPTGPLPLAIGSIGTDLTALYGASWTTRSDLFWGVVGYENTTKTNTLYASKAESPIGTIPGTPKAPGSNSAQAGAANAFQSVGGAYALNDSLTGSGGAASNSAGLRQLTSDANSWASQLGGTQSFTGNSFSYFPTGIEGNFGAGTAGTALDLYQIIRTGTGPATAANNLGYFQISNSGVVSFGTPSPSPVPEPTGIAVGILAGLTGLMTRRRQRVSVA